MNPPQTAAEVLRQHVTLECECVDRMYLNVHVSRLQSVGGGWGIYTPTTASALLLRRRWHR